MIYLASPYSHPDPLRRITRFHKVCRVAAVMMNRGHLVFCPIAHSHPIAVHGELKTDWNYWSQFDWEMLIVCRSMVIYTDEGWRESQGIAAETEIARKMGRPVKYTGDDGIISTHLKRQEMSRPSRPLAR